MHYCCFVEWGILIWEHPCAQQTKEMWSFPPHYSCLYLVYQCPACVRATCPLSTVLLQSASQTQESDCQSELEWEKKKYSTDGSIILKLAEGKVEQNSGLRAGSRDRSACHLVCVCKRKRGCVLVDVRAHCFCLCAAAEIENADLCAHYCALSPTSRIMPHWQGVSTHFSLWSYVHLQNMLTDRKVRELFDKKIKYPCKKVSSSSSRWSNVHLSYSSFFKPELVEWIPHTCSCSFGKWCSVETWDDSTAWAVKANCIKRRTLQFIITAAEMRLTHRDESPGNDNRYNPATCHALCLLLCPLLPLSVSNMCGVHQPTVIQSIVLPVLLPEHSLSHTVCTVQYFMLVWSQLLAMPPACFDAGTLFVVLCFWVSLHPGSHPLQRYSAFYYFWAR